MLAEACQRLAREEAGVLRRVRLVDCIGERAYETLGGETFDAALYHGVLMYLEDPRPMIHALSAPEASSPSLPRTLPPSPCVLPSKVVIRTRSPR